MSKKLSEASPAVSTVKRKFLVVIDQTPECKVALRFASRRAQHTGGIVTLLHVVEPAELQQWAGVERMMREEAMQEAERQLHEAAALVNEIVGAMPELLIREGKPSEEVRKLIGEDKAISILVLASGTGKENPGPLVSAIGGPLSGAYTIPVTIVPGSLTDEEVDALA